MWEELYLKVLAKKNNTLVIYYENLQDTRLRKKTLKDIGRFLKFKIDDKRLECVTKHPYTKFKRKRRLDLSNKETIKDIHKDSNSQNHSDCNAREIFEVKHRIWINEAIEKLHDTLVKRFGITSKNSNTLKYKKVIMKLDAC